MHVVAKKGSTSSLEGLLNLNPSLCKPKPGLSFELSRIALPTPALFDARPRGLGGVSYGLI